MLCKLFFATSLRGITNSMQFFYSLTLTLNEFNFTARCPLDMRRFAFGSKWKEAGWEKWIAEPFSITCCRDSPCSFLKQMKAVLRHEKFVQFFNIKPSLYHPLPFCFWKKKNSRLSFRLRTAGENPRDCDLRWGQKCHSWGWLGSHSEFMHFHYVDFVYKL